jgi:hypothetical protein
MTGSSLLTCDRRSRGTRRGTAEHDRQASRQHQSAFGNARTDELSLEENLAAVSEPLPPGAVSAIRAFFAEEIAGRPLAW